jgi:hypothetical protein
LIGFLIFTNGLYFSILGSNLIQNWLFSLDRQPLQLT